MVSFNCLFESPGVVMRIAQLVVGFRRGRAESQRALIGANRLVIAALLDLAIADLDPGLGPARITIGGGLEIIESALVVSQPPRINPTAIPQLSNNLGLGSRSVCRRQLIQGNELSSSESSH